MTDPTRLNDRLSLINENSEKESTSSTTLVVVLSLIMSVGLFFTGFGVYAEGISYQQHQYNFVIWYPILCIVVYGILIAADGPSKVFLIRDWKKWKVYAPIGFMWSVNYAFILTANSYTSNLFQVLFTQLQLVYNYVMNRWLLKTQFSPEQSILVLATLLVNLVLIGNEITFEHSFLWILFWQLIYLLNGVGGSVASIFTEAYFKSLKMNGEVSEFHQEYAKVLVLNFLTNFYAFLGNFAFIYIIFPISGKITTVDIFSSNLYDVNCWSYYLMFFGTVVFTISSTILFRYTSVTYTSMVSNIANLLQVIVVSLPIGHFQQVSSITQYMIAGILFIFSGLYGWYQVGRSKDIHEDSILIRYYKGEESKINLFIIGFFVFVIATTLPLALTVSE